MTIPTTMADLSTTASSNSPSDSDNANTLGSNDRVHFAITRGLSIKGGDIASASSLSLGSAFFSWAKVTGTTTVTGISSTNSWLGREVVFWHTGTQTWTHSSTLAFADATSRTFVSGDVSRWLDTDGAGTWKNTAITTAANIFACTALTATTGAFSSTLSVTGAVTLSSTLSAGQTTLAGGAGTALTITTNASTTPISVSDGTCTTALATFTTSGSFFGTSSNHAFSITTNNTARAAWTAAGAFNQVGDFSVATSKFTVASASGNTVVAGTLTVTGASTFNGGYTALAQTKNANYTLALSDAGGTIISTDQVNPWTYTVPPNSSVAFPIGTQVNILHVNGAGGGSAVNIARGAGVSIFITGSTTSADRTVGSNSRAVITKVGTDTWHIHGDAGVS